MISCGYHNIVETPIEMFWESEGCLKSLEFTTLHVSFLVMILAC